MRSESLTRAVLDVYDAALAPDLWPVALQSIATAFDAVGARYSIQNRQTGRVEWISLIGPGAKFKAAYVDHYAAQDLYTPFLAGAPVGTWLSFSECLSATVLSKNEWYNEFVLKCGVTDALGTKLVETPTHSAVFSLHRGPDQRPFPVGSAAQLKSVFDPLRKAALLQDKTRRQDRQSSLALRLLDESSLGVIVADDEGRVIEINRVAERIVKSNDGLTLSAGKLSAQRGFEIAKLARLIADASAYKEAQPTGGRMLVGRPNGLLAYALTVMPLSAELAVQGRPLALILITDPEESSPSEKALTELFGLSPAESRLAAALMTGKTLRGIAAGSHLQITTLRSQLSAVLRKVDVRRQADLIRVLSSVWALGPPPAPK